MRLPIHFPLTTLIPPTTLTRLNYVTPSEIPLATLDIFKTKYFLFVLLLYRE